MGGDEERRQQPLAASPKEKDGGGSSVVVVVEEARRLKQQPTFSTFSISSIATTAAMTSLVSQEPGLATIPESPTGEGGHSPRRCGPSVVGRFSLSFVQTSSCVARRISFAVFLLRIDLIVSACVRTMIYAFPPHLKLPCAV